MFWGYGIFISRFGAAAVRDFGYPASKDDSIHFVVGLTIFTILYAPIELAISKLQIVLSRRFEFQADAFAVRAGRGKELCSALQKMQVENLGEMDPDWFYSAVNFSHPPMVERLKAIEDGIEYVLVESKENKKSK